MKQRGIEGPYDASRSNPAYDTASRLVAAVSLIFSFVDHDYSLECPTL